MQDAFETRYAALNAEQKEAVDTIEGPVMVIAGPGTGKTEILTMRIANMVRRNIAPETILALTFTESGAVAMRRRLSGLIGQAAYRVSTLTFHGFANGIIRDYPEYFPDIVGAASITEIDQVRILRDIIDKEQLDELRPFGDRYYYLNKILSAINELKRQGVAPDAFAEIMAKERISFETIGDLMWESGAHKGKMKGKYADRLKHIERNAELAKVYAAYQGALTSGRQYDYSDMIMQVAAAFLAHANLLQSLREQYEYFLVDEHQDTNDAQNRIIELLVGGESASPPFQGGVRGGSELSDGKNPSQPPLGKGRGFEPNLFVVGDEKQAIYRFQGASLENFLYFQKQFPGVKLVRLVENYRSTQAILDAAQEVAPREAKLKANAGHAEYPAEIAMLASPDLEYYFIARRVKAWIANGADPAEIAVLYRDNRDAAPLARVLEKEGVPFVIESEQDVLGDEEMQKLLKILHAVQHFRSDAALFAMLHVDFLNVPPLDIYAMSIYGKRNHKSMYDIMRSPALLDAAGVEAKDACQKIFYDLSNWKRYAENRPALDAFEAIVRESGFLAALLAHPSATEKIGKLHAFFDVLKTLVERDRHYKLADFFAHIDLMIEHGVALTASSAIRLPGRIRLMTAHKSKGLEFDTVIIMNAVAGKWGARTRREHIKLPKSIYRAAGVLPLSKGELEGVRDDLEDGTPPNLPLERGGALADDSDERNVFYVALTRAKRHVLVTLSRANRDGREQLPSPFIAELAENILKPVQEDVAALEAEFAAHPEIEFMPAVEKTPELRDQAFVSTIFESQGLSVTALNNYLECPWQYFYRNLVRIPEAPNKHLCFGNAVHAALKRFFDALAAGENPNRDYLVKSFEDALMDQPIAETDYEEALAKGRRALAGYYEHYHTGWNPKTVAEKRIEGITVSAEPPIPVNGMIDKMEMLGPSFAKASEDDHVVVDVVDYKTGEPKSRNVIEGKTKTGNGNYKRQLVFYKLLLDRQGDYDMASGAIEFIEPDDKGKYHREVFVIEPPEIAELEDVIRRVAGEIRTLAFWNRTCDRQDCEFCALRRSSE